MILKVQNIPGFADRLAKARADQHRRREHNFIGRVHLIEGIEVKAMTPMDFAILMNMGNAEGGVGNPIVVRANPTWVDVGSFLWVLRPKLPRRFRAIRGWAFGRKLRVRFPSAEDKQRLAVACIRYVDELLEDSPSTIKGGGGESAVAFLASWCHVMLSNYASMTEEKVFAMPLPKLWQYLRMCGRDSNPDKPESNKMVEEIEAQVLEPLRSGKATIESLMTGGFKLDEL